MENSGDGLQPVALFTQPKATAFGRATLKGSAGSVSRIRCVTRT